MTITGISSNSHHPPCTWAKSTCCFLLSILTFQAPGKWINDKSQIKGPSPVVSHVMQIFAALFIDPFYIFLFLMCAQRGRIIMTVYTHSALHWGTHTDPLTQQKTMYSHSWQVCLVLPMWNVKASSATLPENRTLNWPLSKLDKFGVSISPAKAWHGHVTWFAPNCPFRFFPKMIPTIWTVRTVNFTYVFTQCKIDTYLLCKYLIVCKQTVVQFIHCEIDDAYFSRLLAVTRETFVFMW